MQISAYAFKPKRILVVDDDEDVRNFLVESLQILGYTVAAAADALSALQYLDGGQPDVVLLDYAIPHTTGGELAVASRHRLLRRPIVFCNGICRQSGHDCDTGPQARGVAEAFPAGGSGKHRGTHAGLGLRCFADRCSKRP